MMTSFGLTLCVCSQAYHEMLNEKTKFVSLIYVSNVLGSVLPVQEVSEAAHKVRILALVKIFCPLLLHHKCLQLVKVGGMFVSQTLQIKIMVDCVLCCLDPLVREF